MSKIKMSRKEVEDALHKSGVRFDDWGKTPGSRHFSRFLDDLQKVRITWDERSPTIIEKDIAVVTIFYNDHGDRYVLCESEQLFNNGFRFTHNLDGSVADDMLCDETPSKAALRAVQKLSQSKPEFNNIGAVDLTPKGLADSIPNMLSHSYPGLQEVLIRRRFELTITSGLYLPQYAFREIDKVTTCVWKKHSH